MLTGEEAARALGVTLRTLQTWAAEGAPSSPMKRSGPRGGRPGRGYDVAAVADWAVSVGKMDGAARRRALKAAGAAAIDAARNELAGAEEAQDTVSEQRGLKEAKLSAQVRRLEADIQRLTLQNAARAGEVIEVAEARRLLGVFASKLREAGVALQREYGASAYALLEAAYAGMEEALG